MPRSAIPGHDNHPPPLPGAGSACGAAHPDRRTLAGIADTPFGDLFNHLRHGTPMTMYLSDGLRLPAPLFANPFQALERLAS